MADAFNMLYRLFAPLFVVILIIAGVDLSSGLIKNSQEKQTAISVAYAASCPMGSLPSKPAKCPQHDDKGNCLPTKCEAVIDGKIVVGKFLPQDCCMGTNWPGADGKPATPTSSSNPLSSALNGKAVTGVLQSLMQKLMGGGGGGGDTPAQQDFRKPPICKSLTVTPSIPLAPGESATLTWTLEGGRPEAIVVSPGVGLVQGLSVKVAPSVSTTYTVAARNGDGTSTCPQVRVYVGPRNVDDEDTFNVDATNPQYNTDVDIWGDTTNTNPVVSGDSTYDNVSDITITNNSENTNDNYYDFLTSLAADVQESPDTTGGTYYYGDEVDNWELLEYDPVTDISSVVIPEPQIDTGFNPDSYIEDYYTGYEDTINGNGLTNEEIYGIWNRPQNPATGGLGLSGGLSSSANNVPTVDLSPDEEVGILGRVLGWVKNTFCVWCSNTSGQAGWNQFAAAVGGFIMPKSAKEGDPTADNSNTKDNPVAKQKIGETLSATNLYTNTVQLSCRDMENGKIHTGEMTLNTIIANVSSIIGLSKDFTEESKQKIGFTNTKDSIEIGMRTCEKSADGNQYTFTTTFKIITDTKGPSETVEKKIVCAKPQLTILDDRVVTLGMTDLTDLVYILLPNKELSAYLKKETGFIKQFIVFCGDPQKRSQQAQQEKIRKEWCKENPEMQCPDEVFRGNSATQTKACKTAFNSAGILDSKGTCIPTAQKPTTLNKEQVAEQNKLREQQAQIARQREALAKQQQAQQTALKKAQQQAQQKAAAQKAAAQKKQAPQQRPPTQQPPQQPSPQDQSWLQQLLAKLKGEEQPQCVSLTANKTKIRKGEEISLKWVVSGASKIVVTPKVELVTGDGKRYAKARPESSVKYTLIATNDKGQEHRCQSQQIIVVEDTEQALACKGKVGTVAMTIEPSEITRSACAAGQTEQECDDAWEGKEAAIKWDLSCMAQCTLTGPDGLEKDDIDTSKDSDELVGMLRKTSTFKMTCEDWEGKEAEDEVTATVTQE